MKKTILHVLAPLLAVGLMISCSSSDSAGDTSATDKASVTALAGTASNVKHPASSLQAIDLDGNSHQMGEWLGQKPVVINIWGTWCPPCRREIPDLVRLYDEYGDKVEIVSFALERNAGPEQVKAFADQAGMKWVQLLSNDQMLRAFAYNGGVPTTIFFTRDGREINRHIGARNYNTFKRDFDAIAGS